MARKVLIIVTSHAQLGSTGQKTGFWLEELATPYNEFVRTGAVVDIASPAGGNPSADPKSTGGDSAEVKMFLADATARNKLAKTLPLSSVSERYDAYFVAGGHGVMWDLAADATLARLLGVACDAGDDRLVTGQNPASSLAVAKQTVALLGGAAGLKAAS